jgi:hypothetical protein
MASGSVSLDMFEIFGETIETFRTRQDTVVELIWDSQIGDEYFSDGQGKSCNAHINTFADSTSP